MIFKFTFIFLLGISFAYAAPGILDGLPFLGKSKGDDGIAGGLVKNIPFASNVVEAGKTFVEGGADALEKGAVAGLKAAETGYESGKKLFSLPGGSLF